MSELWAIRITLNERIASISAAGTLVAVGTSMPVGQVPNSRASCLPCIGLTRPTRVRAVSDRLAFLLGAGASADAGLPMSRDLTRKIIDLAAERRDRSLTAALNYVVGVIIAHDSREGMRPDHLPDIERVASAVELISERNQLEATPFVLNWDGAIEAFERGTRNNPSFIENDIREALTGSRAHRSRGASVNPDSRKMLRAIERIVDARIGTRRHPVFAQLLTLLTRQLCGILTVTDEAAFDYLKPVLAFARDKCRPLMVASLNYDLGFETMMTRASCTASRGIESWSECGELVFGNDQDVHLVKLHGSIDWHRGKGNAKHLGRTQLRVSRDEGGDPFLIFGQREKLRAEGPFLELLENFRTRLRTCSTLVVIGYAFRDRHINEVISQWLGSGDRWVLIVDPLFPERQPWGVDPSDFRTVMMAGLRDASDTSDASPAEGSMLKVVRRSASDFLASIDLREPDRWLDNLFERRTEAGH